MTITMNSPLSSMGIVAASSLLLLPLLGHLLSHVSITGQLVLAAAVYLAASAEQQRRSSTKFASRATSDRLSTPLAPTASHAGHSLSVPILRGAVSAIRPESTDRLDYAERVSRIRDQECPSLLDACYLDASAAPPFPSGLVRRINEDLSSQLYSNPHSKSPSAVRTAERIESVRIRVMQELFGITDTQDWHLIFTSGATASMKLVGEAYCWGQDDTFSCLDQSHTSLLGIRDIATKAGASFNTFNEAGVPTVQSSGLVALPLQCNATGRRFTKLARSICRAKGRARVLLDAASYLSSSSYMDIQSLPSDEQPDFVAFSFYKVFGYPTGLGGLLVRGSAASALSQKVYYGGGTLDAILPQSQWTKPRKDFVSRFEDGTLHFQGVLAVGQALDYYASTFGPMIQRKLHVQTLTRKLFATMGGIRHANGVRALKIYTNSDDGHRWRNQDITDSSEDDQGPILNFNIQTADERIILPQEVDRLASVSNIHVRTGRHCNAGFVVAQLGTTEEHLKLEYANGVSCDESGDSDVTTTSLRASLCLLNTDEDISRLDKFVRRFFVSSATPAFDHQGKDEFQAEQQYRLETISIYPIKSCAAQDLMRDQKWKLTPHGLQHDREWIVMDLRNGKVLSQKRFPKMTLIRPCIDSVARTMTVTIASAEGQVETITLDLDDDTQYQQDSGLKACVCSDTARPRAHRSALLQKMLSDHLGVPCTLAKQDSNSSRHSKLANSDQDKVPLLFSNESPFLLINTASLDKVSEMMRIPARVDAIADVDERASDSGYSSSPESDQKEPGAQAASFRANFVISPQLGNTTPTALAWTEDAASRFQLGGHTFAVLGQCRRCQMVCIDQKTGRLKPETFQTLAKHRRNSRGRIIFGSHLTWTPALDPSTSADDNVVWVGMKVQVSH